LIAMDGIDSYPRLERPAENRAAEAGAAIATAVLMVFLWALVLHGEGVGWLDALTVAVPLGALFAGLAVAARYPVRALPLDRTPWTRLVAVHAMAAVTVAALWGLVGSLWAEFLDRMGVLEGAAQRLDGRMAPILGFAVVGYLLAVAVHSILATADNARRAEAFALSSLAEARAAELEALRAQLGPHFLFNSLNTVSSLAGREPEAARRACGLLAAILRRTLKAPSPERVALAEELALAHDLLAIEVLRFGTRLAVRTHIEGVDPATLGAPPLLLLPLIENAITHGIAERLEGGEIELTVRRVKDEVHVELANDCDPERRRKTGTGRGLELARRRLQAAYGGRARFEARDLGARFRVSLAWPAEVFAPSEAA
jgi:signal transduction histidine kinase